MSSPYDRILNDNRHPSDKYSDIPKGRLHGFFDLDNQKKPRPLRFFAKFAAVVTCVLIIRSICIGDPIFQLSMQQSKEEEERRRKEKEKGISYNPTFEF